ncbi:MAG: hypothetical protein NVSMB6_11310 [Burkholderiaceae bacterium]
MRVERFAPGVKIMRGINSFREALTDWKYAEVLQTAGERHSLFN